MSSTPAESPGEGHATPAEPGRCARALRRAGFDPGPALGEHEVLLDALLLESLLCQERLHGRHVRDQHCIDGLLIGDQESPAMSQLRDLAGSAERVAQLLRGQAREAAATLVALRRAAAVADDLARLAGALHQVALPPPPTPPSTP